jgi:hypothetical protein
MDYEDLVIQLGIGAAGGYTVQVSKSPAGETGVETLNLPVESHEIDKLARSFGDATRDLQTEFAAELSMDALKALGDRLFRCLLPGTLRDCYRESWGRIGNLPGSGLRIKIQMGLGIPAMLRLHTVPWEYLYDVNRRHFLAFNARTSIVRHLGLEVAAERSPAQAPLSILVVGSQDATLNLERERREIEEAWSDQARVHFQYLGDPTLEAVREALHAHDYHVIHFMGHGGFDPLAGEGSLAFRETSGQREWVSGDELAEQVGDRSCLRLVVLNACWTARASSSVPYAGVATALQSAGVPAVLAMQFPIADAAALAFSRVFYRCLARGDTLDAAVVNGRLAIRSNRRRSPEFGTPVLFQRMANGRIIQAGEAREACEARQAPTLAGRQQREASSLSASAAGAALSGRESGGESILPDREEPALPARPAASKAATAVLLAAALVLAPLGIRACTARPSPSVTQTAGPSTHGDGGRPLAAPGARRYSLNGGQSVFVGELGVEVAAEFSAAGPGLPLTLAVTAPYSSTRRYLLQGAAAIPVPPGAGQLVVLDVAWSRQTVTLDAEPSGPPPGGLAAQCLDGLYSRSRSRGGTCSSHGRVVRWL